MEFSVSSYALLPLNPGIYIFLDKKGNIIYVGKAKSLRSRVSSYFTNRKDLGEKTRILVSLAAKIKVVVTESEIESLLLEANYIKKYKPRYNIKLTDDKSYPHIKITKKEKYPKVLLFRTRELNPEKDGSLYFGPFPNVFDTKLVLKTIRRIFPFESSKNHANRTCLYYHLGLCLCPNIIEEKNLQKEYKQNIRHIIQFLGGKSKTVIKELEKEREKESKLEHFEKANDVQKKLNAIKYVTQPVFKPFDYETNPNLREDLRTRELKTLLSVLKEHGVATDYLYRIECYDISNISGTNATGSMVVLTEGETDKSEYRKFKIRFTPTNKPNDFAMMKEVLRRRFKHGEWQTPNLIIVDGGKGQISASHEVLQELQKHIPLVGLAKREETIITSDFEEISLPKDTPALQLVIRIRNEAHRFAIAYHRKLRSRKFLEK